MPHGERGGSHAREQGSASLSRVTNGRLRSRSVLGEVLAGRTEVLGGSASGKGDNLKGGKL